MIFTKEITTDQLQGLDLHQGDSLRVVVDLGTKLIVQIVKADESLKSSTSRKASAWARKYLGVASGSVEDVRMNHYAEKYGV